MYDEIAPAELAAAMNPLLDEFFPKNVEIIAEPGRFFAFHLQTLVTKIIGKKNKVIGISFIECLLTKDNEKTAKYYINDGKYQSFNCVFFKDDIPTPGVLKTNGKKIKSTSNLENIFDLLFSFWTKL